MDNLAQAFEVLQKLASEDGLKVDKYTIKGKYPAVIKVSSPDRDTIEVDFIDNKPVVKVKKIFTITLDVLGLTLKQNRGIVKLDGFPDVPFDYEEL
jgi:hypothetical protein|tara:strand:- start:8043 stop:8330 length:288 start_codon:yes stop_codon:yes gene_type:complete